MLRRRPPRAAPLAVVAALAVLAVLVAGVALVSLSGAADQAAGLTVFVGDVEIQRAGSPGRGGGHTGDRLATGDTVFTDAASKAELTFPDGSVTRLDSETAVTVSLARGGQAGGQLATLGQSSGLTWNRVRSLLGGAQFRVNGPNHTSAEVRGTEFGYYVEQDPTGAPVIWVDVWSGSVRVTGPTGPPVDGATGQRVTVRQGAPAAPPVPIPAADHQIDFTVFNTALDAVKGRPTDFFNGSLAAGQTAGPFDFEGGPGSDVHLVLSWPGSSFELTVTDPAGRVYRQTTAAAPPLALDIPRAVIAATPGTWHARVRALQTNSGEPYWLIVSRG